MAVSTGGDDDEVMSTINITPFTDVLLVLLIIFIILAAVTKEPPVPTAHNKQLVTASQIVVIINAKNDVQIGSNVVTAKEAPAAFAELQADTDHQFKSVIIKGDPKAHFGTIIEVMNAAKASGLSSFGLANHTQGTPQGQS